MRLTVDYWFFRNTHSKVFPYRCNKCPYRGRSLDLLRTHKRTHLSKAELPYRCTKCPTAMAAASNLAKHMRTMHGCASVSIKPFKVNNWYYGFSIEIPKLTFRSPLAYHHKIKKTDIPSHRFTAKSKETSNFSGNFYNFSIYWNVFYLCKGFANKPFCKWLYKESRRWLPQSIDVATAAAEKCSWACLCVLPLVYEHLDHYR